MANKEKYHKNCPECNIIQEYTNKSNLDRAIQSKTICHSCRMRYRVYSQETRDKMSRSAKLRPSPFKGKHHSEKAKQQIGNNQPDKVGENNPYFGKKHSEETKKKISENYNTNFTTEIKEKMSGIVKKRYKNPINLKKTMDSVKQAMHRPDVRKRHIEALHQSKWIKVKTDRGQVELLDCWNTLGFNFISNYQVKTDTDLFYIDGYDKEHNVVLEYDSKYHNKLYQKQKDLVRQNKIIDILHPKKFWRYNSITKTFSNVIGGSNE